MPRVQISRQIIKSLAADAVSALCFGPATVMGLISTKQGSGIAQQTQGRGTKAYQWLACVSMVTGVTLHLPGRLPVIEHSFVFV